MNQISYKLRSGCQCLLACLGGELLYRVCMHACLAWRLLTTDGLGWEDLDLQSTFQEGGFV
jgi:hypothetical protein